MVRPSYGWMTAVLAAVSLAGWGFSSSGPVANSPTPTGDCASAVGSTCCGSGTGACPAQGVTPPAVSQALQEGTPPDPAICPADNTFGLSLLNTLLQQGASSSGNAAIAPISVSLALQIA